MTAAILVAVLAAFAAGAVSRFISRLNRRDESLLILATSDLLWSAREELYERDWRDELPAGAKPYLLARVQTHTVVAGLTQFDRSWFTEHVTTPLMVQAVLSQLHREGDPASYRPSDEDLAEARKQIASSLSKIAGAAANRLEAQSKWYGVVFPRFAEWKLQRGLRSDRSGDDAAHD